MALSMVGGRPINPRNVELLVGDALATLEAFGSPGDDLQEMLDGPFSDPQARRAFQEQALRRTARRLGRLSPHYRARFASIDLQAKGITIADMAEIPVTSKADLVADRPTSSSTGRDRTSPPARRAPPGRPRRSGSRATSSSCGRRSRRSAA
jgi:hypothetical protein